MSRTGKSPISIPKEVSVNIENNKLSIAGKYGKFEHVLPEYISANLNKNKLILVNNNAKTEFKKFHGLNRSLLANKIFGVSQPFQKILLAQGVGYRFQINGKKLILSVGFSHPVEFQIPEEVSGTVEANTKLTLSSINKELLGQFAATIRSIRPPEPYKGKGIKYEKEIILRKVGKAGK